MNQKIRVSDYIVKFLESKGIDTVFLLSGGGMMHLLDAVGRSKIVKVVSQHHEQCCGFAADGYARARNGLGVAFATSGPGALNLVTAVTSSYQDSTPVLFFTGQSKLKHTIEYSKIPNLRQYGTFEADIVSVTKPITKYSVMLKDAQKIRYELEKAYSTATTGRPGPCLIDIPIDLQGALIDENTLESFVLPNKTLNPLEKVVQNVVAQIKKSKRPIIIAGHGVRVSNNSKVLRKIASQMNIPIVTTGMGIDLIEYSNKLLVGHVGVKGDRAGNIAVQSADLLLCVGTSLHAMTTGYEMEMFAPNAIKILVDPDTAIHERQEVKIDFKIVSDLTYFFESLAKQIENLEVSCSENWVFHCNKLKEELRVDLEPHDKSGERLNYYEIVEEINAVSKEEDIFVTDAGLPFYLMGQAYKPKKGQRMIVSGALGQMGYALPATTGVCFGAPKKRVICITGDGSLQTNIHELSVIQHQNLNTKILIVNNNGYVSIRNTQKNYFGGLFVGTDPENGVPLPDLNLLCQSMGIKYFCIENRESLIKLKQYIETTGPCVIEIMARLNQEVIPTVSSQKLEDGRMISKPIHDMYPFMDNVMLSKYLVT